MTQTEQQYSAHDHLIQIKAKDGSLKDYYPAAYRLYELRLRFPNITIESEIVHMNEEKNFVIVKAIIYDGKTYEEATRRASSLKQGLLSALDKVETAAKARAARDYGVSTELALDSEPEEDLDTPTLPGNKRAANAPRSLPRGQQAAHPPYKVIYDEGVRRGAWTREKFYATASALLDGFPVSDKNIKTLSKEQLQKLQREVERYPEQKAS
jgi:hypothetical protein